MNDTILTREDGVQAPVDAKTKPFLNIGTGDVNKSMLEGATIENSTIGHIGEQIDVKDGGQVLTAEAIAAQEKLRKAKVDDAKESIGETLKDILIPGHKLGKNISRTMDEAAGLEGKSRTSRFDEAVNSILNKDGKDDADIEMSR